MSKDLLYTEIKKSLKSYFLNLKSSLGFTLIELLVVILIIFSVGILIVSILFSALRGANKTNTIDLVRRNGNSAITQMSKMIRYSQSFDGVSIDNNTYYTCDGRPIAAVPVPSNIAKSPESGLQLFWANLLAGFIKQQIKHTKQFLASLIIKSSTRKPQGQVAGAATIGFDFASTTSSGASVASISWNHTVGSGSNRLLVVGISLSGIKTVSSVTYGGSTLTRLNGFQSGSTADIWYLKNPSSGTFAINAFFSAGSTVIVGSTSWTNVDQTNTFGIWATPTTGIINSTSGSSTISIPYTTGDVALDVLTIGTGASSFGTNTTPLAGQTGIWAQGYIGNLTAAGTSDASNGTLGSTISSAVSCTCAWTEIGVAIHPVAAIPTPTPTASPVTPTPTTAPLLPDLTITITDFHLTDAAGVTKSSFAPGEAIYPWVTIKNQGTAATTSPTGYFYTSIYSNSPLVVGVATSSDVNVWAKETGSIAAGASKTYSSTINFLNWTNDPGTPSNTSNWSKAAVGSYTARAYVDSFGHVAESDGGTNNQTTSAYSVSVSPTYTISGDVYYDNGAGVGGIANNGFRDGTEPYYGGATVNRTGTGTTNLVSTATSPSYSFTGLPAGNYTLSITSGLPVGWIVTSGKESQIINVGPSNGTANFSLVPAPPTATPTTAPPTATPTTAPPTATPTTAPPTATPTTAPPTPTPIPYHYVKVTGFDGGKTTFRCDKTANFPSGIASNSASLIDTGSVDVSDCYFTCSQDNIFSPPNIGIKFSLTQKVTNPQFFEKKDSASFQTSVSVRNY